MHVLNAIIVIDGALIAVTGFSIAGGAKWVWRKVNKNRIEREAREKRDRDERHKHERRDREEQQKRLELLNKQIEQCKAGTISIQHHMLYELCNKILAVGYVTTDQLDDLRYIFESYHDLGGNGTGELLYQKVLNLEVRN